jgi:hypothetical protein
VPLPVYEVYRATGNYISPDGRTVQYSVGLHAGDPGSTAAMNAVPAVRCGHHTGGHVHRRRRLGRRG